MNTTNPKLLELLKDTNVSVYLDPRHIYNYVMTQDQVYIHDVELDCVTEITDQEEIQRIYKLVENQNSIVKS